MRRPPACRCSAAARACTRACRPAARRTRRRRATGLPTLILGDFNEDDSGRAVTWLLERGFTNVLGEFDRKTNTWQWPTSVYTFKGRLDHILYSPDLRGLQARVIRVEASDHYPVFAIFEKAAQP